MPIRMPQHPGGYGAAPAPPPPPPPPFSWMGFYIGGNLGAAWGTRHVNDTFTGLDFSRSSDGVFIGGGQIGYNWQMNNFVLGIEWDFDGAGSSNRVGNGILIGGLGPFTLNGGGDRWMFDPCSQTRLRQ